MIRPPKGLSPRAPSPEQEPRDFIDSLKNTFKAMIEYPNPLATYFKQNAPNVYRKEENGKWIREMSQEDNKSRNQ